MVTRHKQLFWAGIVALTIGCVFILPFAFPPQIPTFSSSYTIGFNNRVAAIATALISLFVAIMLWRLRAGAVVREPAVDRPMPLRWLGYSALAAVAFTAFLGWRVVRADVFYGDAGYFIAQLTHGLHNHATLYRDLEFAYGPLLFWWPASFIKMLGPLGIGPEAAYMVSLAAMQVAGLAMVFYILGKLPLLRRTRGIALVMLAFGTLEPMLALNYTMFRFAWCYAAILWIADRRGLAQQAALFVLAQMMALAVSAEVGIAFALGVGALGVYRAAWGERRALLLCVAPVAGALLFVAIEGWAYFRVIGTFGKGGFNSIVDPSANIVIFLLLSVGVAPFAVAGYIKRHGPSAAGVVGVYGASLGMVPSALGHSDSLHTFFSGVGFGLLALLAIDAFKSSWSKVWLGLLALSAVLSTAEESLYFRPTIQRVLLHGPADTGGFDMDRLLAATHGQKIAAPLNLPQPLKRELMRDDKYEPSFFCGLMDAWDESGERIEVAEMRKSEYALVPLYNYLTGGGMADNRRRFRIFRLGYTYKQRHPEYILGSVIEEEVRTHWVADSAFGDYMLYRQR